MRLAGRIVIAQLLAAAVVVGLLVSAPAAQAENRLTLRIHEDFSGYGKLGSLDDGDRFGPSRVVFDGVDDGPGIVVRNGRLRLRPQASRTAAQTNAALVVSRQRFDSPVLHVRASWVTRSHTRVGPPNPWEVGWLVWDYQDNDHFTYLVLKPNGWEVGRRDPAFPGGQRFIADDTAPQTALRQRRVVTVDRIGTETTVRVDGQVLVTFEVGVGETSGAIGMYCEDSVVDWLSISAST